MNLESEARKQLRWMLGEAGPDAAASLRRAVAGGLIDGHRYWRWATGVGCVLGTLEHARGAEDPAVAAMDTAVWPISEVCRVEDWAEPIAPGTELDAAAGARSGPYRAAMLVQWIDEWEAERVAA